MRGTALIALLLVTPIATIRVAHSQTLRPSQLAFLRFDAANGKDCEATVDRVTPSLPRRRLAVSCGGKVIFTYITDDHLIDLFRDSSAGNRIFIRWEGGAHIRLTVVRVAADGGSAASVFDETLGFAPDILAAPDDLLVYRGQRFIGSLKIPTRTDVYAWKANEYKLEESYHWNDSMRYRDRFCVLDRKALACPATLMGRK